MLSMTERPLEPQSSMDCYALELLRVQDDFTTLRARRVLHHKILDVNLPSARTRGGDGSWASSIPLSENTLPRQQSRD